MTVDALHIPSQFSGAVIIKWLALPADEDGGYVNVPNHSDKTIHIFGTFGGASVTVQGSNDDTVTSDPNSADWWTTKNSDGESMSKATSGGWLIMDNPLYMRVLISGGDVTTDLNCVICAKRG